MKRILFLCLSLTLLLGSCSTSKNVLPENEERVAREITVISEIEEGSEGIEARVESADDNLYILTLDEEFVPTPYSSITIEGVEGDVYIVRNEETFALPSSFMIVKGAGSATLKTDTLLKEGISLKIEEGTARFDTDAIAKLTGQEVLIRLSGGSLRENYVYVSSRLSEDLIEEYDISAVINLTGESFESPLPCYVGESLAEAFLFMIDTQGPFLIASKDADERLVVAILLSSLMGARGDQIRAAYTSCFDTGNIEELREVMESEVDVCLATLNGGAMPTDSQLLNLSTNYLNATLGLAFSEIPSLRLSLR